MISVRYPLPLSQTYPLFFCVFSRRKCTYPFSGRALYFVFSLVHMGFSFLFFFYPRFAWRWRWGSVGRRAGVAEPHTHAHTCYLPVFGGRGREILSFTLYRCTTCIYDAITFQRLWLARLTLWFFLLLFLRFDVLMFYGGFATTVFLPSETMVVVMVAFCCFGLALRVCCKVIIIGPFWLFYRVRRVNATSCSSVVSSDRVIGGSPRPQGIDRQTPCRHFVSKDA